MLLYSHRGEHADYPENTFEAFGAAVRAGAEGVETDVCLSGDGIPILFHDAAVGGRPVADLPREQISRYAGHEIPSLDEVLLRLPTVAWMVDVKAPAAIGRVIEVVTALAAGHRVLLTSRIEGVAAQCARAAAVPVALHFAEAPPDLHDALAAYRDWPALRAIVWDRPAAAPLLLREAALAGWRNFVLGVDETDDLAALARIGVEGVVTDRLDRLSGLAGRGWSG